MKTKLSAIAILAATTAMAQEVILLDEVSLSANFDEVETDRTGAQVEIATQEAIEKAPGNGVVEVLGQMPGVSVKRTGPLGSASTISVRGTRTYESKFLIDGIDVSDVSGPQVYFNPGSLMKGAIDRVEVVKGSQSALYGSGTVGGLISVETPGATKDGLSGRSSFEYGSYNTLVGALTLAHRGTNYEAALTYETAQSDGFSAWDENDGWVEDDGFAGNRLTVKGNYDINDALTVGLVGFVGNDTVDTDATVFDPLTFAPVEEENGQSASRDETGGRVYLRYESTNSNHELSYSTYDISRSFAGGLEALSFDGSRQAIMYDGHYSATDVLGIDWKLAHNDESYASAYDDPVYGSEDKQDATTDSIALGVNYSPTDMIDLNLATRYDDNSIYGDNTSYRLAMAYNASDALTYKASYGSGFRAPSLYEANYNLTENLQVENSVSYDLGATYAFQNSSTIGANVFHIETDNLIQYVYEGYDAATFDTIDYYKNIPGKTKRDGLEIYGDWKATDRVSLNYSLTHILTEDGDGERLTNIPKDEATLGFDTKITDQMSLGMDAKFVRDVLDYQGEELDDYNLVNARMGYELGNGELYLRVENLFDEQYQVARDFGTSDRAYYVGYSLDF